MSQTTIIKSRNDEREYRVVTLENKLQCLLIHDKDADKSAASLSVNVGFHQDPTDRPGLAHFLEHMLFLGTEKYPHQDEYANYISENSGTRNAFTDSFETNYFFDCSNQAFNGALDRFSKFFICPLFTESCTEREINAVNSEHEKNILQDIWRQMQLFRSTSKEGHVFNRFGTGTKDTLGQPTIRADLLEFHEKYYSANIMKGVISGKENLETLEQWAKEFFGPIKNNNVEVPKITEIPFGTQELGTFWRVFPVKDKDSLVFTWILEDFTPHYKNNPIKYVTHLLGHEGPNSLLSYLMDEGLATALYSSYHAERGTFCYVSVTVELTKKGLENYKQVCSLVSAFVKTIQQKGPEKRVFEEQQKTLEFQFDYKDKENPMSYTYTLATSMHFYPVEDLLRVHYLMEEYNPELIQKALKGLSVDNLRIHLISKSVEKECDKVEKWYNQKYSCEKFNGEFLQLLEHPQLKPSSKSGKILDIPPPNEFIPEKFDLFATDFESLPKYPEKIYESDFMTTFFKQDNTFKKPKASVILKAYCNDLGYGYEPKTFNLLSFWLKLFNEALREILYQAETAKLIVNVHFDDSSVNGIKFHILGFNDSIDKICIDLFKMFKEFDPSKMEEDFKNFKHKTLEEKKNFSTNPPYLQSIHLTSFFFHTGTGTLLLPEVSYDLIEKLTFEDLLQFHRTFFKTIRFEGLFVGNLTKEKVIETNKHIESILGTMRPETKPLPKELIPELRFFKLEPNATWFYERVLPNNETEEKESNSAFLSYYQFEEFSLRKSLLVSVLCNYIKSPCFNVLRTEEQLGYIVHSANYLYRNVLGLIILIQSNVKPSHYLSQRVSNFLEKTKEKINEISDEEFKKHVESVKEALKEKDRSIAQEGERYWSEVNTHKYLWNKKEIMIQLIDKLNKEELKELFNRIFFTERKALEIHVVSQQHIQENEKILAERLANEKGLKAAYGPNELLKRLSLYPDYYSPLFEGQVSE